MWQEESGSPDRVDSWCHKPALSLLVFFELFWFRYLDFLCSVSTFWNATIAVSPARLQPFELSPIRSRQTYYQLKGEELMLMFSPASLLPCCPFFHLLLLQWPLSSPFVSAPSLKSETSIYFYPVTGSHKMSHFLPLHFFSLSSELNISS